jgi:Ser/Thr protein kinase RdoA (MazF antagonist)
MVDEMKAYEALTPRGKLRRIRGIASQALEAFGFTTARMKFIVDAGNTMYRVKTSNPLPKAGSLYVNNCYLLRLHWPGYHNDGAVDSELEWLVALCNAGLPVPQPITTRTGELSVEVSVPGVSAARRCSLLRWVKGRMVKKLVRPWHMKAIGGLIARIHDQASSWKLPPGFVRRHYDQNGLWGDATGTNCTANEVWQRIPQQYFKAFQEVTRRMEQIMEDWGKEANVYGLIHADIGTKANVLFHSGEARVIDFDDAGFGYWMYDLAIALSDWEGEMVWSAYRDALLEGYTEIRTIPDEQLEQLKLFQAAVRAMEIFWGTAILMRFSHSSYWRKRREKAWRHIRSYLRENP